MAKLKYVDNPTHVADWNKRPIARNPLLWSQCGMLIKTRHFATKLDATCPECKRALRALGYRL